MKRILTAALLVAFAIAPSLAQAATVTAAPLAPTAAAEGPGQPQVSSKPSGAALSGPAGYAAREAATPALGNFRGGSVVIFLGGGAVFVLVIVLVVLLI
jgi:hypothetical protein